MNQSLGASKASELIMSKTRKPIVSKASELIIMQSKRGSRNAKQIIVVGSKRGKTAARKWELDLLVPLIS